MKKSKFITYLFVGSIAFAGCASAYTVTTVTTKSIPKTMELDLYLYGSHHPIRLEPGTHTHKVPEKPQNPQGGIELNWEMKVKGKPYVGMPVCRIKGKKIKDFIQKDLHFTIDYDAETGAVTCNDTKDDV